MKPHSITVTITSSSNGEENQRVILQEGASTEDELVEKGFVISDHVIKACFAACRQLAEPYLKGK